MKKLFTLFTLLSIFNAYLAELSIVPDTKVRADYCNTVLSDMNQAIYCDPVAGATLYEWEFTDPSSNVYTYVRQNGIQYVRLSYLGLGATNTIYDVRVKAYVGGAWGSYSTVCTITSPANLPAVQISTSSCNITLANMDDFFYCDDVPGADYYQWEFTDPSSNVTTYSRTNGTPNMKLTYAGLTAPNVQYDVRVRGNFGGTWGPYGSTCTITSPADAYITNVVAGDCGRVLTSFTERIYCEPVAGATLYQWELKDPSNNYTYYNRLNGTTNFELIYAQLTAPNVTYEVRVRPYVNGFQAFGPMCTITSPCTPADAPSLSSDLSTVCIGYPATLTISGNLNNSSHWAIYSGSCGGTLVGTTTSNTFEVTPSMPGTTYYVRGEGTCGSPGSCSSISVFAQQCVPDTKVRADYCGVTLSNINDLIYCDPVAGATQYEWQFTDPSSNVSTIVKLNGVKATRLTQLGLGATNTAYSVKVRAYANGYWGQFSTACTVTSPANLPAVQIASGSCNVTLSDIEDFFYCDDVLGADFYEWEFTDPSTNVVTYARSNGTPNMKLVYAGLYDPNVLYNVRVRGSFGGYFGPYGSICTITSPASTQTTQVTANDCGRELTSFTEAIYCDKVPGAVYYQWKFVDPSSNVTTYTRLNGTTIFKLAYMNLPALNVQYDVQVRAYVNGAWKNYGAICTITSPSTAIALNDDNDPDVLDQMTIGVFAGEQSSASVGEISNVLSETTVYPNPFNDNVNVVFGNYEEKQITIYNSLGQVVMNLTTSDAKLVLETSEFIHGIYMMQVTSGNDSKVVRLIKK